ncbi:hypothetical protein ACB092_06G092000 [Castanea dentata]
MWQLKNVILCRQKPLWTQVPALDLDTQLSVSQSQCLDSNNRTQSVSFFTHIVSRVLALNKAPVLRDFCLTCHSRCDPLHLETWILTAIARDVQQLQLDICLDGLKDLRLVHVFFRNGDCVQRLLSGCPVLQDLKLCSDSRSGLIRFEIRVPTLFKNLVRLNLTLQKSNWHVLQALLRVSPKLEVLVIDKYPC